MSKEESWFEERQSAWLYRELARCESDPKIVELFGALAHAAESQADKWRVGSTEAPPPFTPSLRARITVMLARAIGPRRIKPMLAAMKVRGISAYDAQRSLAGHLMPTQVSEIGARHKGYGGGNLRAAVFGVNDGLEPFRCCLVSPMLGHPGDAEGSVLLADRSADFATRGEGV